MGRKLAMPENKFKCLGLAVLCTAFVTFGFGQQQFTPRLQEKLDHAVEAGFGAEQFELEWIQVDPSLNQKAAVELGGKNLFRVRSGEALLGFGYLGQAPSMKDVFDYVVLFEPDLDVHKAVILIYREDYGRQVGSQRWLKQFIGKKAGERLVYSEDTDGISGATISAKSMTMAVDKVLEGMELIRANKVLD